MFYDNVVGMVGQAAESLDQMSLAYPCGATDKDMLLLIDKEAAGQVPYHPDFRLIVTMK